jgi:hypothetical protein
MVNFSGNYFSTVNVGHRFRLVQVVDDWTENEFSKEEPNSSHVCSDVNAVY